LNSIGLELFRKEVVERFPDPTFEGVSLKTSAKRGE
jgi:hypothetical protein